MDEDIKTNIQDLTDDEYNRLVEKTKQEMKAINEQWDQLFTTLGEYFNPKYIKP